MELKQYIKIVVKRIWILLLLPLLSASIAAYACLWVIKPVYEANTTLYVINKSYDSRYSIGYSDMMAGQYLVKDYRELIRSRTVTRTVIENLGLQDISPEGLALKINVSLKNDTRILEVRVQDPNPENAAKIADQLAEVFLKKAVALMKVENVEIVDKAMIPKAPVKPKPIQNTVIAFIIGLMTAAGTIVVLEYLDNAIKNSDDVDKHLGLKVIGIIPVLNIK